MQRQDIVVYADPDGRQYVAMDDDGDWWIWPAVADGWRSRRGCPVDYAAGCEELPAKLADLALRLSGARS
jgi:hypothetical protein